MRPEPLDESVRRRLSKQKRSDTTLEIVLRKCLHGDGFRFRLFRPVPGRPRRTIDIAFVAERVAVLADGCFWHACPLHGSNPRNNSAWWRTKLASNVARDADTNSALREHGWSVIRVWEHESPFTAVDAIESLVLLRRAGGIKVGRPL